MRAPFTLLVDPTTMKIAYRAKDITEAEIIKGMLLANGIEAYTSGFYLQGAIGDLAPSDFSRVHVNDEDFTKARELIKEYEGRPSDQDISQVRKENSSPPPTQIFIITLIVVITIFILIH